MSARERLEEWAERIETKCTSGHRLTLDAVAVASLWKAMADAVSEMKRMEQTLWGKERADIARLRTVMREVAIRTSFEAEACLDCAKPDDPFTKAIGKFFGEIAARLREEAEK